jgi:DNA-binding transcriptional MocR family regulator
MSILEHIIPVQRLDTNRAEEIARKLGHLIAEWGLEAGASLGTKEDLHRRFQVSPGTMNEAVRIVESRGIVEMRRGSKGGVFVSTFSIQAALKQVVPAPITMRPWLKISWRCRNSLSHSFLLKRPEGQKSILSPN